MTGCVSSQPATKEEMTHEFIISVPGVQKGEAFEKTLKWIANHFRSAKAVIEYKDKESGSIIGNGIRPSGETSFLSARAAIELAFTMNVDVRDEKARIRFVNIEVFGTEYSPFPPPNTSDAQREAQRFEALVGNLAEFINHKDNF